MWGKVQRGISLLLLLLPVVVCAQAPYVDTTCSLAIRICSGQTYSYTAWTGSHPAQSGPFYDCLGQHNDPAWFYFMAGNTGNLNIHMASTPCKDIDFICWGPFTSLDEGCNGGLTSAKVLDCSYNGACTEDCYLPSMVSGQYYILLITNFSMQACTVNFGQNGGTGIMECIPLPTVSNSGPVCAGQNVQLNCSTIAGGTYHWTGPNGFSSNLQNPLLNNTTPACSGTYSVVVTVGTMILNPVNTLVTVNPLPNPVIIPPSPLCYGSSIAIGGGSFAGFTYNWTSVPPGFTSTLSDPLVSPLVNTSYYLTVTSDQNCTSTASTSITIRPLPTVFVLPSSTVCGGTLIPLGGNPNPTYIYSWTSDPPGLISNLANPVVSPVVTTTYTLVVTNVYNCSRTYTVTITVDPAPLAYTGPDQSLCSNEAITLGTTAVTGNTYYWTSSPGNFTSTSANPTVSPSVTTVYTLTETNTLSGCSTTHNVTITVGQTPVVSLANFFPLCNDAPPLLLSGGLPAGGIYSGIGVNNGSFWPSGLSPGSYTITYTYTNAQGCSASASKNIQVVVRPRITGTIRYQNLNNTPLDSCTARLFNMQNQCIDSSGLLNGDYSFYCLQNGMFKVRATSSKSWGGGNATDALMVAKYAVGMISFTDLQKKVADVNNSGSLNVVDAYFIVRRWAGMISSFASGDWYITNQDSVLVYNQNVTVNLQALCYGDVDGSYLMQSNPAPRPAPKSSFITSPLLPSPANKRYIFKTTK